MPKLSGRIVELWANQVVEKDFGKGAPEGKYLPIALSGAVPLWQAAYAKWTPEERMEELKKVSSDDFCLRMEWLLHHGPKAGDTAKAFNDFAKALALLSFCPGGVKIFGVRWQMEKKAVRIQ